MKKLYIAYCINNSGWIVGSGSKGAFLLKPTFGVCVERPAGDTNDDCKVDMIDLSQISSDWLVCGLSPVEACNP